MTLSPQFLDELRTRTLLSGLIARTVKLTRAGREWKACCPFHNEKTPSFTVNDEKGFYHCFGCSAHGDAIGWMTEKRGLPFMDAVKELAQGAGMEVPAGDPRAAEKAERANSLYDVMAAASAWFVEQLGSGDGAGARAYLDKRGISEATRKTFAIGLAPDSRGMLKTALAGFGNDKLIEAGLLIQPEDGGREPYDRFRGRLMIPIRDRRGRVIAFGGRILGDGEPKYLNSPETPLFDKGRTLFNLDRAAAASRETGRLVLVEGFLDVISLSQAGIGEVVAPLGTAVTEAQLEAMWRLTSSPILCLDGDSAGQKAAGSAALRAMPSISPDRTLYFASLPDGQDPDDLIKESGLAALETILAEACSLDEFIWRFELSAAPLDTPEARAGLRVRLRDHARLIRDNEVREQYLATFNDRVVKLFKPQQSDRYNPIRKAFEQVRPVSDRMLAIAQHGIAQTSFVPALLHGYFRHPQMIAPMAETIILLWIKHRRLRQFREVLLDAALAIDDLDTAQLRTILTAEGLGVVLKAMEKPITFPYAFLRDASPALAAEHQLVALVEALTISPGIEATLVAAIERYKTTLDDDAEREVERLRTLKWQSDAALMVANRSPDDALEMAER